MASTSDQFIYLDSPTQFEEWVDFDQFLDLPSAYGDEYSASTSSNSVSPEMALPYDMEMLGADVLDFSQSTFADMTNYDASQDAFFADLSPQMGMLPGHNVALEDSTLYKYPQYDASFDFRQMVEAQAAADPRIASIKEKRREAAIALHLQRLCDAAALDLEMSSDSNTSFSSPAWSEYVRGSNSPSSASVSAETPSAPAPAASTGGIELVLDLNMNTAANLPKKQKPRSQAQKENYIKARKYGACEKHKKQHKRCNCLEKAAVRVGVNDVPMNVAYKERPQQLSFTSPVLPDARVPSVPGHDRQPVSPTLRPLAKASTGEVLRRAVNKSPGHDPSNSSSSVLPSAKTTVKRTSGIPGQNFQLSVSASYISAKQVGKIGGTTPDPTLNVKQVGSGVSRQPPRYTSSAFLTPVKEASKNVVSSGQNVSCSTASIIQPVKAADRRRVAQSNLRDISADVAHVKMAGKTAGSVGPDVSRQPRSVRQSVKATNRRTTGQSNLRWRIVGFSPTTDTAASAGVKENRNTRQIMPTKSSITSTPNTDVRHPRTTLSSSRVDSNMSLTKPISFQAQSSTPASISWSPGTLGARTSTLSRFQTPLDILSSRVRGQVDVSCQDRDSDAAGHGRHCTNTVPGQNSLAVRSISTHLGVLLSSSMSAIAGIGLTSVSFVSWSEQSIGKCLSRLGNQLMSARKILQSSLI